MKVVHQVDEHGWQSDYIVDERGGCVSQSCDDIMPVPRILGLVGSGTPIEVEQEIRLAGNLPMRYQGGPVG